MFAAATVPGRGAALDVCVASSNAAAARGARAQAACDRKNTTHYQHQIPELRTQGFVYKPVAWTPHGRPRPAATRATKGVPEAIS